MTVADLVKFSVEMLKRLHDSGISTGDYRHLAIYEEYESMKLSGDKTTYIVATLAEKYGICERKVYKLLRHFKRECQFGAAL